MNLNNFSCYKDINARLLPCVYFTRAKPLVVYVQNKFKDTPANTSRFTSSAGNCEIHVAGSTLASPTVVPARADAAGKQIMLAWGFNKSNAASLPRRAATSYLGPNAAQTRLN